MHTDSMSQEAARFGAVVLKIFELFEHAYFAFFFLLHLAMFILIGKHANIKCAPRQLHTNMYHVGQFLNGS